LIARHRKQDSRRPWLLWTVVVWFLLVNGVFYWQLFRTRIDDLNQVWQRLLDLFG